MAKMEDRRQPQAPQAETKDQSLSTNAGMRSFGAESALSSDHLLGHDIVTAFRISGADGSRVLIARTRPGTDVYTPMQDEASLATSYRPGKGTVAWSEPSTKLDSSHSVAGQDTSPLAIITPSGVKLATDRPTDHPAPASDDNSVAGAVPVLKLVAA